VLSALLALASAFVFGTGVALQLKAALEVPQEYALRLGLLTRLIRRPLWLLGLLCDIAGFALQAAALASGSLVVVQLILTIDIVFTLAITASWAPGQQVHRRDWIAVGATLVGLGVFLGTTQPSGGSTFNASTEDWFLCTLAIVGAVVITAIAGRGTHGSARATWFAVAAGLANAFLAVLAKALGEQLDRGVGATFRSWQPYAVAGAGLGALLLIQSAYQAGHASITLPTINVVDPVVSSIIGLTIFGEHVEFGGLHAPMAVLALLVMGIGLLRLARAPVVVRAHEAAAGEADGPDGVSKEHARIA